MNLAKYRFELSNPLERLLKDTQVEGVQEDLKFSRRYLNVLVERLEKELDDKLKEDESVLNYDSPNWELRQAERLGYRRALRKVLELINPIEETND